MSDLTRTSAGHDGIVREGFGETALERRNETSATALAAQAQAEVNARFIVAERRPRNLDDVRVRLLRECSRPLFAAKSIYALPKGKRPGRLTGAKNSIEGLTVRFAESALRLAGNVLQQTASIYDDDYKRVVRVVVTDLETNTAYARDLVIEKTIERSEPKDGAVILGQRQNSAGNVVYIVQATEDELLQKESALVSKSFRTLGLRLIPPDIIEECEQRLVLTNRTEDARDPDAARKTLLDGFVALNILPSALSEYLGHDVATCSPAETTLLRGLYVALRDGEIAWSEVISEKGKQAEEQPATTKAKKIAEEVRARAAAKSKPAEEAKAKAKGPDETDLQSDADDGSR